MTRVVGIVTGPRPGSLLVLTVAKRRGNSDL